MTELLKKAKQMINTLDFDGLAKVADGIDDITNPMLDLVLDRMCELDEARFVEYCEKY